MEYFQIVFYYVLKGGGVVICLLGQVTYPLEGALYSVMHPTRRKSQIQGKTRGEYENGIGKEKAKAKSENLGSLYSWVHDHCIVVSCI